MDFALDGKALWILIAAFALFFLLCRWASRWPAPSLFFPDLSGLKGVAKGWRLPVANLPRYLLYGALGLFAAAFVDPRLLVPRQGGEAEHPAAEPVEGIAIYLLLDQSGSMADAVTVMNAKGERESIRKIDLLKQVSIAFVKGDKKLGLEGRPDDMIGIVALARGASVLAPLTLDHKAIAEKIAQMPVLKSPEEGGTVIGYGIFKTANLIATTHHYAEELIGKKQPAYDIKSNVIILVTDGFQDPNPLDKNKPLRMIAVPDAANFARQVGVRLYIVDIDPAMGAEEYAAVRHQMQHAAESTGGKYYLVQGATGLADIYSDIDRLEKSALPTLAGSQAIPKEQQPRLYRTLYLAPALLMIGLLCLSLSCLLDATLLRRVP